jgi:hypothetical protein
MADLSVIPAATLRKLAVSYDLDPRSIVRELRKPGSVRGMAGERARRAVREFASSRQSGVRCWSIRRRALCRSDSLAAFTTRTLA